MKLLYTKRVLILIFFLFYVLSSRAQLTIDSTFSPTLMVQTLLGAGISASNISYTGDTLHASGFFSEPGGAFGVTSGIMLTTGTVSSRPSKIAERIDYSVL